MAMKNVGIVGVSGFSGAKALELLLKHPSVRVVYLSANSTKGKLDDIWPFLAGRTKLICRKFDLQEASRMCDVIFLAVPHTVSMNLTPKLLKNKVKVIDLSGDYRLDQIKKYKKWYGQTHKDPCNIKSAVYGLPELYREDIKKADLIANPGCYPTASILALTPMTVMHGSSIDSIIIDAKSGVSGAGRKVAEKLMYASVNENFKAYKLLNHQHAPEIELYLSKVAKTKISTHFVPHLLPVQHGILETIYVQSNEKMNLTKIHNLYKKFYKTELFVRIHKLGIQPELKDVVGTNFCDIGFELSSDKKLLVITTVIDNLIKGAAGQAVQNMNIMCGYREEEGLL